MFKDACCLDKRYLQPKIQKILFGVPGHPVIFNCGTATEKVSEFLQHHLESVMNGGSF